jgi:P-type Cu2+ transporter
MAQTLHGQVDADQQLAAPAPGKPITTVLHTGGVLLASEKAVVERALGRKPGVASVECNPAAQTATVVYDPRRTSVAELRTWVQACGFDCAGESVPTNLVGSPQSPLGADSHAALTTAATATHPAAVPGPGEMVMAPDEAMGHGGHAGMSMSAMVLDTRNRFVLALVLSIPITLWSPIGRRSSALALRLRSACGMTSSS